MRMTILSVSYPIAPVSADPVGGAEQVLAQLDRAIVAAGCRSIVVAPEGSVVAGQLSAIPAARGEIAASERERIQAAVRERVAALVADEEPEVVHLHGLDFDAYLPPPGPAALVTLHLPLDWYRHSALAPTRPRTWLQPVSSSQAASARPGLRLEAPIENGVELASTCLRKRNFAFALGRICPEKGFHDAIDAAARAGIPLLLAGSVFPYADHQRYFRDQIEPRLCRSRRWIGPVSGGRKRRLLAGARCVLVPSRARETSSLVAMEALAAGTPVIAYGAGALPDIVEHGRTGFIVRDAAEMAAAIKAAVEIDTERCRRSANERFSAERMRRSYLGLYADLAARC